MNEGGICLHKVKSSCTTYMNGIQYCEKRNEICFMEGECIHKPDHAENEEWKLL